VWQRGTSFTSTTNNTPLADRWRVNSASVGSLVWAITRESSTVASGSQYSMKIDITTAGTGVSRIITYPYQHTRAYNFDNRTVTVSARVWCNQPNSFRLGLFDGATGTYSSYHPGNSTWQTLTITRTFGNTSDVQVWLIPEPTVVATHYVDNVMMVYGDKAVDYVPQDPATELMRCQRYYQRYANIESGMYVTAGNTAKVYMPLIAEMAATPTLTTVASGTSGGGTTIHGATKDLLACTASSASNVFIWNYGRTVELEV